MEITAILLLVLLLAGVVKFGKDVVKRKPFFRKDNTDDEDSHG